MVTWESKTANTEHIRHNTLSNNIYMYLSSSVGRALGLESRVSWVRVPPEAADFSLKKSLPQVSLNCVVFLCVYLEGICLSCIYLDWSWPSLVV